MGRRSDDTLFELPETTELEKNTQIELNALLQEAHSMAGFEKRLKEIKGRIIELAQGMPGVRYRDLCAVIRYQDGKRTLDRTLLVENGVTPEQIDNSMKQSVGYWVCELPRIQG